MPIPVIQFFFSLSLAKIIRCHQEFGEIYSLALDKNYLLTGHTLTTTCVQVWNISGDDLLPCSTMREYSSESIIWNIHLGGVFQNIKKKIILGTDHLESTILKIILVISKNSQFFACDSTIFGIENRK